MPATFDRELRRLLTRAGCIRSFARARAVMKSGTAPYQASVPGAGRDRQPPYRKWYPCTGWLAESLLKRLALSSTEPPQLVLTAQGGTSLVISTPAARGHSERLSFAALRDGAPDFFRGSPACRDGRYRAG